MDTDEVKRLLEHTLRSFALTRAYPCRTIHLMTKEEAAEDGFTEEERVFWNTQETTRDHEAEEATSAAEWEAMRTLWAGLGVEIGATPEEFIETEEWK